MRPLARGLALLIACWLVAPLAAWADGVQFSGTCSTISWNANTEPDLAGYRLYDRVSLANTPTLIATFGPQITSQPCSAFGFNAGQHYLSLSAFDASGNESAPSTDLAFVIVVGNQVSDLHVSVVNATDMTLTLTEVDDGAGSPASYDVRVNTPTINWGTAPSVTSGTCASPVSGTAIGASKSCTVTGLSATTPYQFQLVPYRGTPGVDAVYGPLSNIAGATTGGSVPPVTVRETLASLSFGGLSNGPLGSPWVGGYTSFGGPADSLQVASGQLRAAGGTNDATMTYAGITLPDDQWCEITLTTITGSGIVAPRCLLAVGAPGPVNGYEFTAQRNLSGRTSRIAIWVAGTITELVSENATTWTNGDVLRAEKIGSVLTLYRNGAQILTADEATFAGGRGGVTIYSQTLADGEIGAVQFGKYTTAGSGEICGCDNH